MGKCKMKINPALSANVTLPYNDFKALMENQVPEDFDLEQKMLEKNCEYIDTLMDETISGDLPLVDAEGFVFFQSKTGKLLLSLMLAHRNEEYNAVEREEAIAKILTEAMPCKR